MLLCMSFIVFLSQVQQVKWGGFPSKHTCALSYLMEFCSMFRYVEITGVKYLHDFQCLIGKRCACSGLFFSAHVSSSLSSQAQLQKMDLRVTSILLLVVVLAEATPDRYYHVKKQPYPTKSHSEFHFRCVCVFVCVKSFRCKSHLKCFSAFMYFTINAMK